MRRVLLALCTALLPVSASAVPAGCGALLDACARIADEPDGGRRSAAVEVLWSDLVAAGRLPFVAGDSVVFLMRRDAGQVTVAGDFNGWDPKAWPMQRVRGTDLWLRTASFPRDARLDYKFVADGGSWLLDPHNPHRQRGGFGDNSELRMPDWEPSLWTVRREGVTHGVVIPDVIESRILGCTIHYTAYAPADFEQRTDLPVIYVTDGHEYADDAMGAMINVMDNLVAAGRLRPTAAIFIDPRIDGVNRRAEQYVMSEEFLRFVAEELVPHIDSFGFTSTDRRDRAILGTSLGGLNSAWFAARRPGIFGRIGIMSPAFQAGDGRILDVWRKPPRPDVDMVMTWGTFHDFGEHTTRFRELLDAQGAAYTAIVTHEGHSWGQWRALVDDVLLAFWPALTP
jgi:enterochelin esterase-like enzyme